MKMISKLKKNNGSTLTLVMFMLFLLSVTAIAVITLTGSELSMSVMTSDRSKALLSAKAGAENAVQVIDTAVAQAQENARLKASEAIQHELDNYKTLKDEPIKPIPDTSPFFGKIDNYSTPGEIKIIDEKKWNDIYENEYKYQFYKEIENVTLKLSGEKTTNGSFSYKDVKKNPSQSTVKRALDSIDYNPITSVSLVSAGEYTSPSRGSTYKRSISAEFSLLTTPKGDDIPVTYGKLTKVRINKDIKPSILDNKALIAEKNIISLDGTVEVTGKTVCFGTVPANGNTIKYDVSNGYAFGGIMAGMVPDNSDINYTSNFWTNPNVVSKGKSLKENMKIALGYDDIFFNNPFTGSFKFNNDVGTLAYLHSMYSTDSKQSEITVGEDTYATSVKVESEANYSQLKLNNVFTYDDLRIDGNNSDVKIGDASASVEKKLVGMSVKDPSSTVIVSGDSKLNIYGSVYVGGSTVFNEYINSDTSSTECDKPYVSGMSIQKSDNRPIEAFLCHSSPPSDGSNYPDSTFHFFNTKNKQKAEDSAYVDYTTDNGMLKKSKYNSSDLMSEIIGESGKFELISIMEKAMHLKYVWNNFWKDDIGYSSYFNTGDIRIEPTPGGQIKGFCFGGVAANDTIYGPYNGFVEADSISEYGTEDDYTKECDGGKDAYVKLMDLFLSKQDELTSSGPIKKLSDSVYKSALLQGTNNSFFNNYPSSFMLYKDANVVLDNSFAGGNDISGYKGGIIYSTGDIYVKAGTNFKGILIAEGNIVFLGNAHIEYNENVVDDLLMEDPQIGRFFKHTVSDVIMNDPNAIVQTVKKRNVKNIKIISWKEIKN